MGPKSRFLGGRGVATAALLAVLVAFPAALPARAAPLTAARPGQPAAPAVGTPGVAILDVAVLVDESGSETKQSVADEQQTAGTIVQTMLNPASRVTVIGFGGVNNVVAGQSPVDLLCQPTIAGGAANLDYLANCVGKIHKRSEAQGDDTDYAAALAQAMSYLGRGSTATPPSPPNAIKVVLMLTDGAVDVHRNTVQYGSDWRLGQQTAVNQQLAEATSSGVQVWPLGFGTDVGTGVTQPQALKYLNDMAAHGAPAVCDTKHAANQPHATWVNSSSDAIDALNQLYADAACLGTSTDREAASHGLSVAIPAIASSAAISVDRVNPAISVTFTRPDGQPWTDSSAISGADNGSPTEVLHLANVTQADVGTWHIKLTAPSNLASQLVSATVFWQGAVRAIITATPSVKPGQPIAVKLTVLGPNGPISDPRTLASLVVGVVAAGPGLSAPVPVPVTAATGPGSAGTYSGTYTAPGQPTTLTINGSAAGYGLYTTQIPATVTVGTSAVFNATPHFSGATSVQAGDGISGTVDFTNQTGHPKHVLLKLTASGTTATISPDTPVTVPSTTSGNPPGIPFTVTVDKSARPAAAQFAVQAVDADTGQPYNAATALVQVTTPPGFLAKYKWIIFGILALLLLAIAGALAAYKIDRDKKDVRGLVATLRRGGGPAGRELAPGEKWAEVFPFIIRNESSDAPYLDHPARETTTALYQVRRAGRGKIRLTTPTGLRPYEIEVNGPGLRMERGLELSFRDTRHLDWVGTSEQVVSASDWSGAGTGGTPDATPTIHDWAGSGPRGGADDWSGSGGAGDWNAGSGSDDGAPTITMKTPPPPPPPNDPWL